jgi:hypothetical protein
MRARHDHDFCFIARQRPRLLFDHSRLRVLALTAFRSLGPSCGSLRKPRTADRLSTCPTSDTEFAQTVAPVDRRTIWADTAASTFTPPS